MKTMRKILKSTRGQSMVEMAIMLPLLLLIFFGIIEFGIMLGSYVLIHDLARDGVRAGVVGASDLAIRTQIKDNAVLLDKNKLDEEDAIVIDPDEVDRKVGDSLTVRINYDYDVITPIISKVVGSPVEMSAQYKMRIEDT